MKKHSGFNMKVPFVLTNYHLPLGTLMNVILPVAPGGERMPLGIGDVREQSERFIGVRRQHHVVEPVRVAILHENGNTVIFTPHLSDERAGQHAAAEE